MEGCFCGEKKEKTLEFHSVIYFLEGLKEMNRLAFKGGGELAIQRLKYSFVCNIWGWAKLYIGEEPHSLIGFLEWLASR